MYADYEYYQTEYGGKMSADDYKRFGRRAEHRIDGITGNKLQFSYPTNERDVEAVKDCVCELADFLYQIDSYNAAAMESMGTVAQADGTVKGKVITSISSGSESIGYSAGGSAKSAVAKAAESEKDLNEQIYSKVSGALYGVRDSNGVPMLNAEIPYPRRNAPISRPPENKPTIPDNPPESKPEESEKQESGKENETAYPEDEFFVDSVVVYNRYVNGLYETEQYFGTRFDNVRIEFTQEENQNKAGKEDASVCILKIRNNKNLPKPFLDPRLWEKLTTNEMLENFTLDVDGDFFVIVKRKGLNIDIEAPVNMQESNSDIYGGNFFEYMKENYGYVYSINSFEQFEKVPYFQVGGL